MRNVWLILRDDTCFSFDMCENILVLGCGSACAIRPDDMYTHRETGSAMVERHHVLGTNRSIIYYPRVREGLEGGEGIDEKMHTIDGHVYAVEMKM